LPRGLFEAKGAVPDGEQIVFMGKAEVKRKDIMAVALSVYDN
jgi:hypothetical protein